MPDFSHLPQVTLHPAATHVCPRYRCKQTAECCLHTRREAARYKYECSKQRLGKANRCLGCVVGEIHEDLFGDLVGEQRLRNRFVKYVERRRRDEPADADEPMDDDTVEMIDFDAGHDGHRFVLRPRRQNTAGMNMSI